MSKQSREQSRAQRAAAVLAEQQRKQRNRRVALVAGIIVLLGAIVAGGAWYGSGGSNTPTASSAPARVAAGNSALELGKSDAKVKVVIYEDFLCPFCRELENSTRTFLRENAAKGRVYVEYQPINLLTDFPYSAKALNAWAAVLKHATPEAALKLHDLFFDKQPYEQSSGEVTESQIADWVKQAGGDNAAVREAMKTRDAEYFALAQEVMNAAGVQGTPTVFINGKELPAASVTDMVKQIEAAVEQGN